MMDKLFDYSIRPFLPQDQKSCKQLILGGLEDHFGHLDPTLNQDVENIVRSYLDPGNCFLVAESDEEIIGTGALVLDEDGQARIQRVSVLFSFRGRGVGQVIVQQLISRAAEAGSASIAVETNHDWFAARNLYEKAGFKISKIDEESVHFELIIELK